jgi:hypothetical protein
VLKVCWVEIGLDPQSVVTGPVGTFGRRQFEHLASIPGMNFPPPAWTSMPFTWNLMMFCVP